MDSSFSSELQDYRRAVEEEFKGDETAVAEQIRDHCKKLLPDADMALEYCLNHAEKESTRLSAAKFVYTVVLGRDLQKGGDDSLEKLMRELRSNDPAPEA